MRPNVRAQIVVALALAFTMVFVIARAGVTLQQGARTESSSRYDTDGSLISTETDYDGDGKVIETREFKNRILRKRTKYIYLKGFKKPNTSTTNYGPDGKTPAATTNEDNDKDGNPTSSVTTNYDARGNETGGSKRERDPNTGKDRCYKWDPKKQGYDEVPCPQETVQASSTPQVKPSPKVRMTITDRDTSNNTCPCSGSDAPCPCPSPSPAPTKGNSPNARVELSPGLQKVNFDTPNGRIVVNLPDDMRAGDTISGTVIEEPKGQTSEERAKNQSILSGYVVAITPINDPKPAKAAAPIFIFDLSKILVTPQIPGTFSAPTKMNIGLFMMPNEDAPVGGCGRGALQAINESCSPISQLVLDVPGHPSGAVITPDPKTTPTFTIPGLGQTGRPIVITGPFDGDSSNTKLSWSGTSGAGQDAGKNSVNDSGGLGLIAESPREAVFKVPNNVTGPNEIQLKEGDTATKGNFRNLGVNLTAPKTNLIKGEHTELHIEVSGLQGITGPVPLTITSQGVITMEGGMYQPLVIQPSQVGADGRYTTTRGITGIQSGGWSATATVVIHPFDACLQDDGNGNSLIFDTTTGDYIFSQPGPAATGSVVLPWIAQTRGALVPTSDINLINPDIKIMPCVITLDHNVKDRTIHAQVDTCTHAGSATVQTNPPRVKFTITDRNTRDNTCACGPGCKN